jgi:hypothetical protein
MLLLQAVILLDVIPIPYSVKSQVNRSIQPGVVVLNPQDPKIATQPYLASKHPGQLYPFGMCPHVPVRRCQADETVILRTIPRLPAVELTSLPSLRSLGPFSGPGSSSDMLWHLDVSPEAQPATPSVSGVGWALIGGVPLVYRQ